MSLEAPVALWGLASLALLALFSLWRQAAERVTVPSLALWKKIPERNPPIRALRRPQIRWDLLLQAFAIAAAVVALAGPFLPSDRPRPRRVALVLDTSSRLREGDRIGRIRDEAIRLARGPLAGDDLSLFASLPSPRRLQVEELSGLRAVDEHVDLEPLLAAARQAADHVLLLSDRAPSGVAATLFGGAGGNVGITAFGVSDDEVFARIANHGARREVKGRLKVDGRETEVRVNLPAGEHAWHRREALAAAESVVLELETGDAFPVDDRAGAVRVAGQPAAVTVTGSRDEVVLKALGAVPGVVLRFEGEALVSVGVDAAPGPAALRVRIHPPSSALPGAPAILRHPLTAGLEGRASELGRVGELPPEARAGEPLIVAGERRVAVARPGEIHLSVDLDPKAGWPAFPSFPIFWTNVLDLARKNGGAFDVVRTGRPFALPADATVVGPPDPKADWSLSDGKEFLARTAGEYVLRRPAGDRRFLANLLDARESDTAGTTRDPDWDPAAPEGREPERTRLGGWLAGAALGALALAWLLQRRGD